MATVKLSDDSIKKLAEKLAERLLTKPNRDNIIHDFRLILNFPYIRWRTCRMVLLYLLENERGRWTDLLNYAKCSRDTLSKALKHLTNYRLVEKGSGYYVLSSSFKLLKGKT